MLHHDGSKGCRVRQSSTGLENYRHIGCLHFFCHVNEGDVMALPILRPHVVGRPTSPQKGLSPYSRQPNFS